MVQTAQFSVRVEVNSTRLFVPAVDKLRHLLRHQLEPRFYRHHHVVVVHFEMLPGTKRTDRLGLTLIVLHCFAAGGSVVRALARDRNVASSTPAQSATE